MTRREYISLLSARLERAFLTEREVFTPGLDEPMTMADCGIVAMEISSFGYEHRAEFPMSQSYEAEP